MSASRPPLHLFVVPSLALLVALASLFLAASPGSHWAAKILVGPTDGETVRGRILVLEEGAGVVAPAGPLEVEILAEAAGHRVSRLVEVGPDGWAEFSLPRHGKGPLDLEVRKAESLLARGRVELSTVRWLESATSKGVRPTLQKQGDLSAQLVVHSGVLGVPFPSRLGLRLEKSGEPLASAAISLEGESLVLSGPGECVSDETGTCSFSVTPTHHVASLQVTLRDQTPSTTFEWTLPVVPGSLGVRRSEEGLIVSSAIPRQSAWYTFVTKRRRLLGGRVVLNSHGSVHRGLIPAAAVPSLDGLYVVVSSEADGRSPSTVGIPLSGQVHSFEVWDAYVVDGLVQAREERERREQRFRYVLGGYAALSGLLSLALFWSHVRRSERQLSRELERAGVDAGAQNRSALPLLIAALCLFFAFSATVLWIVAR